MLNFLKKPINFSLPFPVMVVILVLIVVKLFVVTSVERGIYFGHFLLGMSLIISISGFAMAVSKKERERARLMAVKDLPDRAELINAPDSDAIAQRRGFLVLGFGVMMFAIWCYFYGLESLAAGV